MVEWVRLWEPVACSRDTLTVAFRQFCKSNTDISHYSLGKQ